MTEPASPPTPATRLPGLEALRCVAALCVLLLHTRAVYGARPIFARGYLGVDFFLMLGGFLMARVQEPRLNAGLSPLRFLAKRYRRLWPMMAAGGLIGLPMEYLRAGSAATFAWVSAANLALLPVWGQIFAFPLNIPAWTIFAQMLCEGAHALGLRHLRGQGLAVVIMALGGALAGFGAAHGSFDLGARPETLLAGLVRCLFAYALGMGLARWWGEKPPLPVPPLLALGLMPALMVASWALDWRGWWVDGVFVLLACPLMLAGGLRLRLRRGARLAGWVGQLSFPLFALQMPVLEGLRHLGAGYWQGLGAALTVGIGGMLVPRWWHALRNVMRRPCHHMEM